MSTELLISSDPLENRVALLENGALAEIYIEREEKVIGSIFKGKVQNVLPGMGASFVDIGLGRNAFLYVDDINKTPLNIGDVEITQGRPGWTITEKVNRGDEVLVQIVKEPRGLKGARISTNISLPGRYLILMPNGKYSGVSRKVATSAERDRLKTIMKLIRPEGMATVVRTAASGVSQAELIADLGVLIRMWHGILESFKRAPAPALIHKDMNLVYKAARDFITPEVERVLIDNGEEFEKVRDFMRLLGPQYVERIQHYNSGRSLFKDFKIDDEIDRLLKPMVKLPSGGSIVIESTEALTVIDVNSGKFTGGKNLEDTIVKTNIEAAAEIARQVRLRDIGGIIVCDFIDMNSETSRTKVLQTLEEGLKRDRTRTTIQSFSALGLLEFTRKRVGKDLAGQLRGHCPTCLGLGTVMSPETVAIETFRELRRFGHTHPANGKPIEVDAAATVGAQLNYWYEDEVLALEKDLGAKLEVRVDPTLHPERTKIHVSAGASAPSVRVGDELEVDVLHARLPNPTSAMAVVGSRLVEIENAANALGQTIRIKIIDIDDEGNILAEPRTPVVQLAAERIKRRRRGGRGRPKPLTIEEQTEELLELAEEAAKGLDGRTAIGISTVAEAEAEAVETRESLAVAPVGAAVVGENGDAGDVRRKRRRRRRRRPGAPDGAQPPPAERQPADRSAGLQSASIDRGQVQIEPGERPAVAAAAVPGEDGGLRRRRRRRRRRGRGGMGPEGQAAAQIPGTTPERTIFRVSGDGRTESTGRTAAPEPSRAIAPIDHRSRPVAVAPPPPSLRVSAEAPKVTKPVRGRPRSGVAIKAAAELGSSPIAALPSAVDAAPKRRGRPRKSDVAATELAASAVPAKRVRRTKSAADAVEPKLVSATRTRAAKPPTSTETSAPQTAAAKPTKARATKLTATRKPSAKKAAKKATTAQSTRTTSRKK